MKNTVELIGWYGGDEAIALSAWTSTSRDLTDEKRLRIPDLIKQLWAAEPVPHGTPFEKGIVHFLVTCDVASHIHLLKHRVSSINAESARYKELKEDKYYLPDDWIGIERKYNDVPIGAWYDMLEAYTQRGNDHYHACLADLTPILGRKRAKETARYFKTYNSQITCDVMFNMRSFHNFLIQRLDGHAQLEIQYIAWQMLEIVRAIDKHPFKHTLNAWDLKFQKPKFKQ